ncbi:alpha/beta fold hydrolase [Microbacterium sp. 22215]|uniref:alpha/beta fold hydrolase n=1 Tax=Microbacterium sp. 22215 TaxID=3453893 RepID=UPI003F84A838
MLASIRIQSGTVDAGEAPEFTVSLAAESWDQLLAAAPLPGTQHLLAHLRPRGTGEVRGSETTFAQHLHLVRRTIEVLAARPAVPARRVDRSGITGRYVQITVAPWGTCDVFVEEAGSGRPVLLLHTAGADSSQFHGLMSLRDEVPGHRLIAFDLPWHGRSAPARGSSIHDYALTSESYADCIAAVIEALELLEPPILVGASMAGAAVVETAARHPGAIAGAIGCQAGPRVANRSTPWLRHPQINQALFVPEWTFGLMSPHSPKSERDRVWWGYSQGGYGVYERDIAYYSTCWDIDNVIHLLGADTPPIVLMSGAYDYTVPPDATRELADIIPHAIYRDMPELGHFPHAENPVAFAAHLTWALEQIDRADTDPSKDLS